MASSTESPDCLKDPLFGAASRLSQSNTVRDDRRGSDYLYGKVPRLEARDTLEALREVLCHGFGSMQWREVVRETRSLMSPFGFVFLRESRHT